MSRNEAVCGSAWEESRREIAALCGQPIETITNEDVFAFRYPTTEQPMGILHMKSKRHLGADRMMEEDPGFETARMKRE